MPLNQLTFYTFSWYPDYFDEISEPMSLFMINKKLKRDEYRTLEELLKDIVLVFENAKTYNVEGSDIYEAAAKLEKLARSKARTLQKVEFYFNSWHYQLV